MAGAESSITRAHLWTALVLALATPFTAILCLTLWSTPFPADRSGRHLRERHEHGPANIWIPDTPYYRPLFYLMVSAIWHHDRLARRARSPR